MLLEHQEGDIKWIFARNANHNKLFNDFCKIQAQNLKTFTGRFQVVIHFHLGHPWQKTLSNSFTQLVWYLNKKMTNIFRLSYMLMRLLAFQWVQPRTNSSWYCPFKPLGTRHFFRSRITNSMSMYDTPFYGYWWVYFINHINEKSFGFEVNGFKTKIQQFKMSCSLCIIGIPLNYRLFCSSQCID